MSSEGDTITIRQIASAAGVAVSTASRALSDRKVSVHPDTRAKVLAVARRLDYMPSAPARLMGKKSMSAIGLFWNHGELNLAHSLVQFLKGVSDVLNERRYSLLLTFRGLSDDPMPRIIAERHTDGMLMAFDEDQRAMERLRRNRIPIVLTHAQLRDDCDCVVIDDEDGAHKCVEHLHSLGHRSIGYVNAGAHSHVCVDRRILGYLKGMAEFGLQCPRGYEEHKTVHERIDELYNAGGGPTALLCFDDAVASVAAQALESRGLRIPEDVSVVGFNDSEYAKAGRPQLTSMRQPVERMGRMAAKMMLDRIETPDRPFRQVRLPEELIVRDSTGPACEG